MKTSLESELDNAERNAAVLALRASGCPNKDSVVHSSTDQSLFFKTWLKRPLRTGAIAPSSGALARLITSDIAPDAGPVIELGPGTGVFTRCILERGLPEENLTLVENSPDFTALLRKRFPKAHLLDMDVAKMRLREDPWKTMQAQAVISGLPLLNMGLRTQWNVVGACMQSLRPGAALYQFTYMTRCPIAPEILARMNLRAERVGSSFFNLPPASVYRISRD
ncbi:MAG: rRNA adenine N-6-methyltransferase family protein [Hydrogenophaga sp.]|uniref:class I SAM-dependent methyltransferase n=1 Tax=Hydrogenophaga sp. TaxID=1904254 RepID=UPI0027284ECF|nr:methyltransferase domain-containing protein [Hydrogenophaga sp.]MDO9146853.1 rRNA adenine N-6-methyltransferase family protein [Hydrogenophaga sp.]MDO9605862.1 rRNA adenine N-6-methyltransferase family protein [Hydrogenophaga sp.]MDP2164139.1 rRNA adenine N-6-methyltransferase family protein [Hydrogenophaga sp.]MDP3477916.1 rRNA adenine N-6-methyltransferase family protein [Hydrogenophaga sp.]